MDNIGQDCNKTGSSKKNAYNKENICKTKKTPTYICKTKNYKSVKQRNLLFCTTKKLFICKTNKQSVKLKSY